MNLSELRRAVEAEPASPTARVALWVAELRQGASDSKGLTVYDPGMEVQSSFNKDTWKVEYTTIGCHGGPVEIKHVFWTSEYHQAWTCDYKWWLFATQDGRFGTLTEGSTGTCSHCGSDVYDVTLAASLLDALMQGLSDRAREVLFGETA